jgi:hypothetical protein
LSFVEPVAGAGIIDGDFFKVVMAAGNQVELKLCAEGTTLSGSQNHIRFSGWTNFGSVLQDDEIAIGCKAVDHELSLPNLTDAMGIRLRKHWSPAFGMQSLTLALHCPRTKRQWQGNRGNIT